MNVAQITKMMLIISIVWREVRMYGQHNKCYL